MAKQLSPDEVIRKVNWRLRKIRLPMGDWNTQTGGLIASACDILREYLWAERQNKKAKRVAASK